VREVLNYAQQQFCLFFPSVKFRHGFWPLKQKCSSLSLSLAEKNANTVTVIYLLNVYSLHSAVTATRTATATTKEN